MATTVSRFCEEFGRVEHEVRLQLNMPCAVVKSMQNVQIKPTLSQFEAFTSNMEIQNIVDVFLSLDELKQSANDVATSGVRMRSKSGFRINASHFSLPENEKEYTVVHCKVALGKVHNHMSPIAALEENNVFLPVDDVTIANVPTGYDSLRISDNDDFLIFREQQINTVHILTIDCESSKRDLDDMMCQKCKKEHALVFCTNDQLKLCQTCDKKLHSQAVTSGHDRRPLGDALPQFQECPEHHGNRVQYFCPTCHLPLCMECKVTGSHSHRATAKHKLVPIAEMYHNVSEAMNHPNKLRVGREKAITQAIIEAEENVESLQKNLKAMEAEIRRICDNAIAEARTAAGERILATKSALSELQRKFNDLRDERNLLVNYYQNAEPVPFLQTYYRTDLINNEFETPTVDLQKSNARADLSVYGSLQISCPKPKSATTIVEDKTHKTNTSKMSASYMSNWPTTHTATNSPFEAPVIKYTTLEKMAHRKLRKYSESGKELTFVPFAGSDIINDEETARLLYLSFPFKQLPETHLMFSSESDGRDAKLMHDLVDGKGISVVIVRSGEFVFGGFAASKWNRDSVEFGHGGSSFLFSITHNAFIPAVPSSNNSSQWLYGTPDSFSFGGEDLILRGNFDRCASTIEHTFGVGFDKDSEEAQSFLAGKPIFRADVVEVWGFFSPSN